MSNRKPGRNIEELAARRRAIAMQQYTRAALALLGVVLLFSLLRFSGFGMLLIIAGLVGAWYFYGNGQQLMRQAGNAERGAAAERDVAVLLSLLEQRGWQAEYNLPLPRWGDADALLRSPAGHWYLVDVKSHGGTKVFEGSRLRKRYGRNTYDFEEGDLLAKAKGQAVAVKQLKGAKWVTPLLCFTQGDVEVSGSPVNGVYVVTAGNLINTLERLEQ